MRLILLSSFLFISAVFAQSGCVSVPIPVEEELFSLESPVSGVLTGTPEIDLYVAYTPSAEALAASKGENVEVEIQSMEGWTENILSASEAPVDLTILEIEKIEYDDGDTSKDLSRFRSKTDGIIDEVHVSRDRVGADLCVLIVGEGTYCGAAYISYIPNKDWAFAVVHYNCLRESFAHEVGHLMGCDHDEDHAGQSGMTEEYARGWKNDTYRTQMAYAPPVNRIPRFSNPEVTYEGVTIGTEEANNARVIRERAHSVGALLTRRISSDAPNMDITGLWLRGTSSADALLYNGNNILEVDGTYSLFVEYEARIILKAVLGEEEVLKAITVQR